MSLAPIGISTYIRLEHLKQTISALQNNTLAKESDLYIFSDAARHGDEQKVEKVRRYLRNISGFREVNIIERDTNNRVFNNRDGMKQLLDEHGRMIFMEEDIVTAPGFLQFMNDALEFYKNDERVINITGYMPPIVIPNYYMKDYIVIQRFNAWGYGIWKHKFDQIDLYLDRDEYEKNIKDKDFFKKLVANGEDIPCMLEEEINGHIDALDVKIMYQQIKNGWHTISPTYSLVQNIGHDGSGVHCGVSDKFNHKELWGKKNGFKFLKDLKIDKNIAENNFKFRRLDRYYKFIILTKKYNIFPLLRYVKRLVLNK